MWKPVAEPGTADISTGDRSGPAWGTLVDCTHVFLLENRAPKAFQWKAYSMPASRNTQAAKVLLLGPGQ